eukprot:6207694-Pleurochrysis_carterae.AAC.10
MISPGPHAYLCTGHNEGTCRERVSHTMLFAPMSVEDGHRELKQIPSPESASCLLLAASKRESYWRAPRMEPRRPAASDLSSLL